MGGHEEREAEDVVHGFLQAEVGPRAGVRFVALHHGRPLVVAHGAGAGIGQKVDVDIFRFEQENVVTRFLQGFFTR